MNLTNIIPTEISLDSLLIVLLFITFLILISLLRMGQVRRHLFSVEQRVKDQETYIVSATQAPDKLMSGLADQLREQSLHLTETAALMTHETSESETAIKAIGVHLAEIRDEVKAQTDETKTMLAGERDQLITLAKELQEARKSFVERIESDGKTFLDMFSKTQDLLGSVVKEGERINKAIGEVESLLKDQVKGYEGAKAGLLAAGEDFNRQLTDAVDHQQQQTEKARNDLHDALTKLTQAKIELDQEGRAIALSLEQQRKDIEKATQNAKAEGEQLTSLLSKRLEDATNAHSALDERATQSADQVLDLIGKLDEQIGRLTAQSTEVEERLFTHSQTTIAKLGESSQGLQQAIEPLLQQADELDEKFTQKITALNEIAGQFAPQLTSLESLLAEGATWQDELASSLDGLKGLIGAISDERVKMASEFQQGADSFNETTDSIEDKVKRMTQSMQERGEELLSILNEATNRLAGSGGDYASRAGLISDAAREAVEQLKAFGDNLDQQSERLTTSSVQAGLQFSDHQESLQRQALLLQKTAEQAATTLQEVEDRFAKSQGEMQSMQDKVVGGWKSLIQDIKLQVSDNGEVNEHVCAQLQKLYDSLSYQSKILEDTIALADGKLGAITGEISQEAGGLQKVTQQLMDKASEVSKGLTDETQQLQQMAERSLANARQIKDNHEREARDLFNRTSRHIIEDLNSISIDLTRALDGEVPEADWRRYVKGDRTIFSRSLLRNRQDALIRKIAERVRSDGMMRSYVTRYVELFDQLLQGAAKSDSESLLHATFLTSDVGKLYLILNKALGREE